MPMLREGRLIHINKVLCVDFSCNDVVAQEVGGCTYIASVNDFLFPLPTLEKFVVVYDRFQICVKICKGNELFLFSGSADLEGPLIVDV